MIATIFWAIVTVGMVILGVTEEPLALLGALATGAYTVYLGMGGSFRLFIF